MRTDVARAGTASHTTRGGRGRTRVTWVADTRAGSRASSPPARLAASTSGPCWSGPGRGRTRPARAPTRSGSPEHLLRSAPAVLTAAVVVDVLVVLAPALLPGARGSAAPLIFLVLPSVVVAARGSRRWIALQSLVVVASCGVVLATAA